MECKKTNSILTVWMSLASVLIFSIITAGCDSPTNPKASSQIDESGTVLTGSWSVKVRVQMRDEFYRFAPAVGPFEVVLTAKDRRLHTVIPKPDSVYTFTDIPYQEYLATVKRDGYITESNVGTYSEKKNILSCVVGLYPLPSPETKINAIKCNINSVTPRVQLQLSTVQKLPVDGRRYIVLYAGIYSGVSSRMGTYAYASEIISQPPGTSEIVIEDIYRELHAAGIPTGSTAYVTARIITGSIISFYDPKTGLKVYDNLENNTTAEVSFIMP